MQFFLKGYKPYILWGKSAKKSGGKIANCPFL